VAPTPDVVPDDWKTALLADVASTQLGKAINPRDKHGSNQRPYLRNANVQWDHCDVSDVLTMHFSNVEAERLRLEVGDLLTCEGGVVGRSAIWRGEIADCCFQNAIHRIRPLSDEVSSEWLLENLRRLCESGFLASRARGNTIQHLSQQELRTLPVRFPARRNQDRLVAVLGNARRLRTGASTRLKASLVAIERFRRSVLTAACSGRLTTEWRRENALEARQHGAADSHPPTLPPIPQSWSYQRLDSLNDPAASICYGIVLPGPDVPGGIPYVRQQDVVGGTVLMDGLGHTTPEIAGKHSRSSLREGDVLLCIIRNLRVAIVPHGIDGANITQGMVRIRPGRRALGPYLAAYLESPYAQRWMTDQYVGLAMPRINVADARAIPVPVPPVDEQAEIVQRVDVLLDVAGSVARRIETATEGVARSAQAILEKAFRGDLIESVTARSITA